MVPLAGLSSILRDAWCYSSQVEWSQTSFSCRLEILRVLTQDGKDIEYMEEAIGMWFVWRDHILTCNFVIVGVGGAGMCRPLF